MDIETFNEVIVALRVAVHTRGSFGRLEAGASWRMQDPERVEELRDIAAGYGLYLEARPMWGICKAARNANTALRSPRRPGEAFHILSDVQSVHTTHFAWFLWVRPL